MSPRATGETGEAPRNETGFWEVRFADEANEPDIYFGVIRSGCPLDQQQFKDEVERTLTALRIIYPARARFDEAFQKLLSIAQLGLVGRTPPTRNARAALVALQAEIVDREAGRIKNAYMLKLGKSAAVFAAIAIVGFFVIDQNPAWPPPQIFAYRYYLLLWAGCMLGTWASFATRKPVLKFFDLATLEEDRIEPALRLVFSGLLTVFLGLVFTTGIANLKIGGFQAANLIHSGSTAILIGGFAGLAEKALPAAMMQRSQHFISLSGGAGAGAAGRAR